MLELRVGKNGDYTTVMEALQAVPYRESAHIFIEEGIYREKLFFEKKDICLEGEGEGRTVITWGDGAYELLPDGEKRGTFRTYTVFAGGENVSLRSLTIENTAGPGERAGQAIALYADAKVLRAFNVTLRAHQDTLFMSPLPEKEREKRGFFGPRCFLPRTGTRQYYRDCTIEGDIDFIFGGADAFFDGCRIIINGSPAYVAAPCEGKGKLGLVFRDCAVTCRDGLHKSGIYLGRPWRPEAKAVYINCRLDQGLSRKGFSGWESEEAGDPGTFFAEYGSLCPDGSGADISGRNDWVRILTDEEAEELLRKVDITFEDLMERCGKEEANADRNKGTRYGCGKL
ncbi:MAG TPA: pectin esterase [Lachnospiraceae bacterium]|nr:pectin esterase [Lachnospiraceae bacterium]